MANCPKCKQHLRLIDWKQTCPHCGANIVIYDSQERLMLDADKAEVEKYYFQKKVDRLKGSFAGSKLAIARIFTSLLPIAPLFLPIISGKLSNPFAEYEGSVNLLTIINKFDTFDIGAILGLLSGDSKAAAIPLIISIIAFALSVVFFLVHFICIMLSCSPKAKSRGIVLNSVLVGTTLISIISFAFIPENSIISANLGVGAYLYLVLMLINSGLDLFILFKKPIEITHKQCYVGGIPIEEYFQMLENNVPHEEIRKEMYKRLEEIEAKQIKELYEEEMAEKGEQAK